MAVFCDAETDGFNVVGGKPVEDRDVLTAVAAVNAPSADNEAGPLLGEFDCLVEVPLVFRTDRAGMPFHYGGVFGAAGKKVHNAD